MIVKYNAANRLGIGSTVQGAGSLYRFNPGVNMVPKDLWETIKKDPIIAHKIKIGQLQVLQAKDGTEITKGEPPIEMIAEMYDVLKLEELAESKNVKIAKAAKKRLEQIHEPEKTAAENDEQN